MINIYEGIAWYIAFLFSVTLHEASHAFAAMRLGDKTAYEGGQVTLDPVPHIKREPVGTVIVPIISYVLGGWMIGWASAPYDPGWAVKYPKRSAVMSLAGPLSNLLLVFMAGFFIHIGIYFNVFYAPDAITLTKLTAATQDGIYTSAATFISILFSLNLILFIFNLIPVPPLDGSGIVPFFLSDENAEKYMIFIRTSGLMFIGILIAWKLFDFIYHPIHLFAINLLYPGMNYH